MPVTALAGKLRADFERLCDIDLGSDAVPFDLAGLACCDGDEPGVRSLGAPVGEGGALARIGRALDAGHSSATQLLGRCLARIDETEPDVRAWVNVDRAGAREQVADRDREARSSGRRGPLHGVPIGVKDMIDVAGLPTGAGSRQLASPGREHVPSTDAEVVLAMRAAGAVILGKTTTHEYAFGGTTPPTCNPRALERIPGGSSGGSAAAVAAGQVPVALGTDTVGSVRIPSAYCGVAGWLPSPGLMSARGVLPLAWSLDRVGVSAASVADLADVALALGLCLPPAGGPVTPRRIRVGVPTGALDEPIDAAVRSAVSAAIDGLAGRGTEIVAVELPHAWAASALGMTITMAESVDYHRARLAKSPELFGDDVRAWLESASAMSADAYVRAQRFRRILRHELLSALERVDLIVTPTLPCVAPEWATIGTKKIIVGGVSLSITEAHLRYTAMVNLADLPAATQPCGADDAGLPVGLQWITGPGRDDLLLTAMLSAEADLPPLPGDGSWMEEF